MKTSDIKHLAKLMQKQNLKKTITKYFPTHSSIPCLHETKIFPTV